MEKANHRLPEEIAKDKIVDTYRTVNKFLGEDKFMNHGYHDPSTGYTNQENLYYHLVRNVDISDKDILDIGCGRGGGLSLLHNKIGCKSATGVDLSPENIDFCKKTYESSISFIEGDAESLPFEDNSFDIVFNIESAHCYPRYDRFLGEVVRVLRPGGILLFTDTVSPGNLESDIYLISRFPGLELISQNDISQQVAESCRVEIEAASNWLARETAKEKFAGYSSGEMKHLSFVSRKVA